MNTGELVKKAKAGTLAAEELDEAAGLLGNPPADSDPYDLLYILGRGFAFRYEGLVASFLEQHDDPMLARLALQILCTFWNKTEAYLGQVRRFLVRTPWDEDEDVRQMAVSIAGEYLRNHSEPELVATLWSISNDDNANEVTRGAAIGALARALGDEWRDLPPVSREELDSDWGREVLRRVRKRFALE